MGSVMDQERPWERDRKKPNTLRERILDQREFGQSGTRDAIIVELEELHRRISVLEANNGRR